MLGCVCVCVCVCVLSMFACVVIEVHKCSKVQKCFVLHYRPCINQPSLFITLVITTMLSHSTVYVRSVEGETYSQYTYLYRITNYTLETTMRVSGHLR